MTPSEVRRRIELIEQSRGDDESAHAEQDQLYVDVLTAIAAGERGAAALAAEALKVQDVDFSRWYA